MSTHEVFFLFSPPSHWVGGGSERLCGAQLPAGVKPRHTYTRTTSEVALLGAASSWGTEGWWQDYRVYALNPGTWCRRGGTQPSPVTRRRDGAHLASTDGHCCMDNIHCTFLMRCGFLHFANAALACTSHRWHI